MTEPTGKGLPAQPAEYYASAAAQMRSIAARCFEEFV